MIETIGQAAGQVWTTLAQAEGPMGLTEVPKRTHLKTQIAYQALGWLAREGKVKPALYPPVSFDHAARTIQDIAERKVSGKAVVDLAL